MSVNLDFFGYNESEDHSSADTLTAVDSGVVQNVTATATMTLPATAAGITAIYRVGAEGITLTISPNASDKIAGGGFTAVDDKDIVATSQPAGSYVVLYADGTDGWFIQRISGTWTYEGA